MQDVSSGMGANCREGRHTHLDVHGTVPKVRVGGGAQKTHRCFRFSKNNDQKGDKMSQDMHRCWQQRGTRASLILIKITAASPTCTSPAQVWSLGHDEQTFQKAKGNSWSGLQGRVCQSKSESEWDAAFFFFLLPCFLCFFFRFFLDFSCWHKQGALSRAPALKANLQRYFGRQ